MKKKYGIGLLAIIVAVSAAAFTLPSRAPEKKAPVGPFYFQFSGSHTHESNIANWTEITALQYSANGCPTGRDIGCRLQSDHKDPTGMHPQSVPVDGDDLPLISGDVTGVKNADQ
jgi:hypothetical protein